MALFYIRVIAVFMNAQTSGLSRGSAREPGAAMRRPSTGQAVAAVGLFAALAWGLAAAPGATASWLAAGFWTLFAAAALWRALTPWLSGRPPPPTPAPARWPRYTVVAALRDEAAMIPQLVRRLSALDYPPDRLEGFLVLETDDLDTLAAVRACLMPAWLSVLIAPPGGPRTKPRALNAALARASGELIVVYDAEDEPDPGQLREAAARFAADPAALACLQAPLRIRRQHRPGEHPTPFLDRQFAAEYAALFEVALPALTRLGLPFPLGGTSNHLKTAALRAVGGWDAWNVTEDADLGFRLWAAGGRLGMLTRPTWETPPGPLSRWLPQRTRWLKGYMQTWGVHMRRPGRLRLRGLAALQLTLGLAIVSAAVHAPSLAWVALGLASGPGAAALTPPAALGVLGLGLIAATATTAVGARRAGLDWGWADMARAPLYWSLTSLAFVHALWRLLRQPHAWDKTPHVPEAPVQTEAGRRAA